MDYQKSNTGFRIGVSVSMIIFMLGIVISLNIFTTHVTTDHVKMLSDLNMPAMNEVDQLYLIQQLQHREFEDALTYQKLDNIKNYEHSKEEFYSYNSEFYYQVEKTKNMIKTSTDLVTDESASKYLNVLSNSVDEINSLHLQHIQTADKIFQTHGDIQTGIHPTLIDTFENEQDQLNRKELLLKDEIQRFTINIESSGIDSEQSTLTLQIVILISAGIISLALGYFLNQINKDLIREVIRKTRSLQKANKRLRRLDSLKDDFINMASHELKSPLNPIYGFVELAQNGDIEKDEAILGISKLVRQLEEVANRILDMSRIDKKRLHLSYEKFDLSELITEIVSTYRTNPTDRVRIETDVEKRMEIEADRVRISQVIRNLLNNALKFTNEGVILVTAHYNKQTDLVDVSIKDNGSGIHPEILPNLFNKFVTKGPDSEPWKGNGLGLYLCRGIIEVHGGHISAYNNEGQGATMRFTIPSIRQKSMMGMSQELVN